MKAGDEKTWGPLIDIINLSLGTGAYSEGIKEAVFVFPLKKPSLDPTDLANYCPVSIYHFWNYDSNSEDSSQVTPEFLG